MVSNDADFGRFELGDDMATIDVAGIATRTTPPKVHLIGRAVALRPVAQGDYEFLRCAELSESLGPRWRFRGSTPAPEQYPQSLWQGVSAQFVVVETGSFKPIGLVSLYNVEPGHGTAYVGVADLHNGGGPTHVVQGAVLFLAYVFTIWQIRKLYFEAYEFNLQQFSSLNGRWMHEEARLRNHFFLGGRYWDLVTLALYHDDWTRWKQRVLPRVLPKDLCDSTKSGG